MTPGIAEFLAVSGFAEILAMAALPELLMGSAMADGPVMAMLAIAASLTDPLTGFVAFLVGGALVSGVGLYVLWDGERAKHRLAFFHLASVLGIWSVVSGTALEVPGAESARFWATVSCVLTLLVVTLAYRFAVHALDVERERRPVLRILASLAAVAAFFGIAGQLDLVELVPEAGGLGASVAETVARGTDLVPRLQWQAALVVGGVLAGLGGALHLTWREWRSDHAGIRGREAAWIALGILAVGGVLLQYLPVPGLRSFPVGTVSAGIGLVVLARAARSDSPPPTGVTAVREAVLDAAWDPMLVSDRDGTIRGVSEAFTAEYGHGESLIGRRLQTVLAQPGDDALTVRRILATGPTAGELPLVHLRTGNGQVVLARIEVARLGHVDGMPVGHLVLFQEASRKRAARSLDRFDRLFRNPRRGTPVPLAVTTVSRDRMLEANDELLELTGLLREECLGRGVSDLGISVDGGWSALARPVPRSRWSEEPLKISYRTSAKRTREAQLYASRVRLGSEDCRLLLIHELAGRPARGSFSRSPVLYDPLTGLPNDILFENRLEHALKRAGVAEERVGVLLVELDGLDEVVETRGRAAGDQTLRVVAHRLKSSFRELDTVGYLGEQGFGVLLEELDGADAASAAATRFLESLNDPLQVWGWTVELSASVGIALSPEETDPGDVEALIGRARTALGRAREATERNVLRVAAETDPVSDGGGAAEPVAARDEGGLAARDEGGLAARDAGGDENAGAEDAGSDDPDESRDDPRPDSEGRRPA